MSTLTFKTNIKCMGCVGKATSFLNEAVGVDNWKVDINNPDKLLRIETSETIDANDVIVAVNEAGFKAEPVQ